MPESEGDQMAIKEFEELIEKVSEALPRFIESIERAVASSAKGVHVIVQARNRRVLEVLLRQLMLVRHTRLPMTDALYEYANNPDPRSWDAVLHRLAKVGASAQEALDILERDKSDLIVDATDTYEAIYCALKDKIELYESLHKWQPPRTKRGLEGLIRIADKLVKMVKVLDKGESVIATYLSDGKEKQLIQ